MFDALDLRYLWPDMKKILLYLTDYSAPLDPFKFHDKYKVKAAFYSSSYCRHIKIYKLIYSPDSD